VAYSTSMAAIANSATILDSIPFLASSTTLESETETKTIDLEHLLEWGGYTAES
jgi:hypothetical protein